MHEDSFHELTPAQFCTGIQLARSAQRRKAVRSTKNTCGPRCPIIPAAASGRRGQTKCNLLGRGRKQVSDSSGGILTSPCFWFFWGHCTPKISRNVMRRRSNGCSTLQLLYPTEHMWRWRAKACADTPGNLQQVFFTIPARSQRSAISCWRALHRQFRVVALRHAYPAARRSQKRVNAHALIDKAGVISVAFRSP